jgi:NADH dehydrogenase/NADH oxidase (H2O2-forming)
MPLEKTLKTDDIVTEVGAKLIRESIVEVDFEKKLLVSDTGENYSYNQLIIATGAEPIILPIKGSELSGVMSFKTEKDLKKVMASVSDELKEAVVIGAGAIGIELAQALNSVNVNTHLVDIFPTILPNMMDKDMIESPMKALEESGIHMHMNEKVVELIGDKTVKSLKFEKGGQIDFESAPLVVFAVGMKPSVDFVRNTSLTIGRSGININNKMETNIKDVYAVGDCCEFVSGITGEVVLGKLATNAVPMARMLAKNILGENRTYPGFYNGAATKVMSYFVGSTGLKESDSQKLGYETIVGEANMTTAFPIMPFAKQVKLKLVVDKKTNKILGGQIVSGEPVTDKIDQITMAIQFGITVDQFAQLSYASQPYQSFFPASNLMIQASEQIIIKRSK